MLSVFGSEQIEDPTHFQLKNEQDILFETCKEVGNALGIKVIKPQYYSIENCTPIDLLETIGEASQFRIRCENLIPNWWLEDCGPLVGFIKSNDRPVAFVQKKNQYFVIDLIAKTSQAITEELAETFCDSAYRIYKTLPDHPLDWRHLLSFSFEDLKGDWKKIFALQSLVGVLALLFPIITGIIFETIIPDANINLLKQTVLLLIVASCISGGLALAQALYFIRIRFKSNVTLQAAIWDRVIRLPLPFFRQFDSGDLANRAHGIDSIQQFLTSSMLTTALSGMFSVLSLFLMFFYDIRLALVAMGLGMIAVFASFLFNLMQIKYQRPLMDLQGKMVGTLFQFLTGINKLRVANKEKEAFGFWSYLFSAKNKLFLKAQTNMIGFSVFNPLFIIFATVVFYALVVVRGKNLSFGHFIAFNVAFGQFFSALFSMASVVNQSLIIIPLFERVRPILNTSPEIENLGVNPGRLTGKIKMQNITFRYFAEAPLVLENISLDISAGSLVAIVGPTGSGKSTLLRLLLGFEEIKKESIFYDAHDLSTLNKRALRKQIGTVSQNSIILPGSIYENVTNLSPYLSLKEAEEAAIQVGVLDEIQAMPMGWHTWIAEGGRNISVGQRQRIMLARAIVHKPRILLLDEATSALDNSTQAWVHENIAKLEITRIVITHRLNTIKNADCIYVLDKGQIVQKGSYTQLIEKPGLFLELVKRQSITY